MNLEARGLHIHICILNLMSTTYFKLRQTGKQVKVSRLGMKGSSGGFGCSQQGSPLCETRDCMKDISTWAREH